MYLFWLGTMGSILLTDPSAAPQPPAEEHYNWDSMPDNPEYVGYRLYVNALRIEDEGRKRIELEYSIVNTGSRAIELGRKSSVKDSLVVKFAPELSQGNLAVYLPLVREALLRQRLQLQPGAVHRDDMKIKLPKALRDREATFTENRSRPDFSFDPDFCSDIAFDTIKIVERDRKHYTLEFTLINRGKKPTYIYNSTEENYQELGVDVYYSGTRKLAAGAIKVDRFAITSGLEETRGVLFAGERFTGTVKVPRKRETRFTPTIILFADALEQLRECDETNNRGYVVTQ